MGLDFNGGVNDYVQPETDADEKHRKRQEQKARLTVCDMTGDAEHARALLEMLGLVEPVEPLPSWSRRAPDYNDKRRDRNQRRRDGGS